MALFHDNLGKLAPERWNQSGFLWSKRWLGGSGISWMTFKSLAPVSSQITMPACHHSIFTGRMLFLTTKQQRQNTEGCRILICRHQLQASRTCTLLNKLLLFTHRVWQGVNLNQQSTVKTARVCVTVHIIVYNCHTQYRTEQFDNLPSYFPDSHHCCLLEERECLGINWVIQDFVLPEE